MIDQNIPKRYVGVQGLAPNKPVPTIPVERFPTPVDRPKVPLGKPIPIATPPTGGDHLIGHYYLKLPMGKVMPLKGKKMQYREYEEGEF